MASILFPHITSFTPSFPAASPFPRFSMATLDDAKDKANQISKEVKDETKLIADGLKQSGGVPPVPTPTKGGIKLYTPEYYFACAFGGAIACGSTHGLVTPLDLVKCRRQVNKDLYKGNVDGWKKIWANEGGFRGIYTGVGATLIGYSIQGAGKFGIYEFFKKYYSDLAGPENAKKYKDFIFLAGSASAEFFADIGLVPLEAVKVRSQTTIPPFARNVFQAVPKFAAQEGIGGFFKSLPSLWSRQIPYTMMKFWAFEATVAKIYSALAKPRDQYNKVQQLGVSFVGGYIAGVFCAVVSHPADTMVSKLNAQSQDGTKPTVGGIYREIGFGGLWAGLGTRIIMIGTLTALQWFIYDYIKVFLGLPTTGAAPPAEKK